MTKANESQINRGNDNVFEDLEYPDADIHQMKAELATHIEGIVQNCRFTEAQTSEALGLSQSEVYVCCVGTFGSIRSNIFCAC